VESSYERGNSASGSINARKMSSGCTTGGLPNGTQIH
jgi:hypothetical protein